MGAEELESGQGNGVSDNIRHCQDECGRGCGSDSNSENTSFKYSTFEQVYLLSREIIKRKGQPYWPQIKMDKNVRIF